MKYGSWIFTILAVAAIVVGIFIYSNKPGQYDTFAMCVANSGTKFYGAFWCPHCQAQKALFGASAKKLPYVECSTPNGQGQTQACIDKDIKSYPTWEFADGTRHTGEISMEDLASSTACALIQDQK